MGQDQVGEVWAVPLRDETGPLLRHCEGFQVSHSRASDQVWGPSERGPLHLLTLAGVPLVFSPWPGRTQEVAGPFRHQEVNG